MNVLYYFYIFVPQLQVDMDTVSTALMILVMSYGIALMVLGIEILYARWKDCIVIKLNLL